MPPSPGAGMVSYRKPEGDTPLSRITLSAWQCRVPFYATRARMSRGPSPLSLRNVAAVYATRNRMSRKPSHLSLWNVAAVYANRAHMSHGPHHSSRPQNTNELYQSHP
ncbi:MAG: hypothetical protein PUE86_09940 [Prevotella sp.]|nr:hypothetical protein [Prevotella sp.]